MENTKAPQPQQFQPDSGAGQPAQALGCCGRQSAKGVLDDMMHRLNRRMQHLQTLRGMLPTHTTAEQDEALWAILCELERR